jgi:hypothetical protein
MANPWFRLYSEFGHDPKVRTMPEPQQLHLVLLFCLRCEGTRLGKFTDDEIAYYLQIPPLQALETKRILQAKGFIDEKWNVTHWDKRQFLSDSSTERVRKYRQGKKQDETLHETPVTPNVTAPEQNRTNTKLELSPPPQAPAPPVKSGEKEIIESAFRFYCDTFGKNLKRYQLTDARREKARSRFRERMKANDGNESAVEADFAHAIENLAASTYHVENGYTDWLAQIFRSQEEFEKRLERPKNGGSNGSHANGNGHRKLDKAEEARLYIDELYPDEEAGVGRPA